MRLRASTIADACGGQLVGPDVEVDGASHDSREVRAGMLFVPIVAARDGHDFVADALAAGAAAYLTSRPPVGGTAVVVDDTGEALLAAGALARSRLGDRVVGITGSVGKTSAKDLLAEVLRRRYRTAATPRNFNNEIGLPITLLGAPPDTEALVLEMGARGHGHIARLCQVGRPTIAVVTRVAPAHTELFGSVEEVARAKAELVEALPPAGTAVLNADDPRVAAMASATSARVVTFGAAGDVRAEGLTLDDELRPRFTLRTPGGAVEVRMGARGLHQASNALGVAAAALAAGCDLADVAAGLGSAALSPGRMDLCRAPAGGLVLDDSYNASPASVEAALRALAALPARRRVAVLGVMAELGPEGPGEHRRLAGLAGDLGVEVVAVGTDLYGVAPTADPVAAVGPVGDGTAVLVKGSRVARLDEVVAALLACEP